MRLLSAVYKFPKVGRFDIEFLHNLFQRQKHNCHTDEKRIIDMAFRSDLVELCDRCIEKGTKTRRKSLLGSFKVLLLRKRLSSTIPLQ